MDSAPIPYPMITMDSNILDSSKHFVGRELVYPISLQLGTGDGNNAFVFFDA